LGGGLMIVDLFSNTDLTQPYNAVLFSLTMLMFTATRRTYSFNERETLLRKVDFANLSDLT
jgi:hypothetical protein